MPLPRLYLNPTYSWRTTAATVGVISLAAQRAIPEAAKGPRAPIRSYLTMERDDYGGLKLVLP